MKDNYLTFMQLRKENGKTDLIFPVALEYPKSEMASLYTCHISSEGSRNKIAFCSPNYLREINLHIFLFYRVVEKSYFWQIILTTPTDNLKILRMWKIKFNRSLVLSHLKL